MTAFANASEAGTYISGVFEMGFADPEICEQLVKSGLILRMELSDPDALVVVDTTTRQIDVGESAVEPNMTLTLSSETANRFWQGKVSIPLAVARGQIKVSGQLPKLLGLLPSAKKLNAQYVERLRTDGREDLIA
ncbi:MAG: sterol carrier protein [Marmoricola sp.]|nr:sterol carrier protein [Marmoricola sp.]